MKIFLAYATENLHVTEEIFYALSGPDYEVVYDKLLLKGGDDYNQKLRETIENADCMIFLISPHSVQKGAYPLTELNFFQNQYANPKHRVLPVMVEPTSYDVIPAYLKAVTILEPKGNIAAEVTGAITKWAKPSTPRTENKEGVPEQVIHYIYLLLCSALVTIGIGTLFSTVYPRVEITTQLTTLFMLVSLVIVMTLRHFWLAYKGSGKKGDC